MNRYSVRTKAVKVAGESGYEYWIYDGHRKLVASGWSRGSKSDALDDARKAIDRLKKFDLSDAEAS